MWNGLLVKWKMKRLEFCSVWYHLPTASRFVTVNGNWKHKTKHRSWAFVFPSTMMYTVQESWYRVLSDNLPIPNRKHLEGSTCGLQLVYPAFAEKHVSVLPSIRSRGLWFSLKLFSGIAKRTLTPLWEHFLQSCSNLQVYNMWMLQIPRMFRNHLIPVLKAKMA